MKVSTMPLPVKEIFGYTGKTFLSLLDSLNTISVLINSVFYQTFISPLTGRPPRIRASIVEMVRTGYNSVPIVSLISFFVGVILALQAAYQLKKFGALIYVADLVGISLTRELGPILTAVLVSGRSGSAFAAEIGSMKAAEEIDALVTMGINPIRYLIVPKLIALMIMMPALTLIADFSGITGGTILASTMLGLSPGAYIEQTINSLAIQDIFTGLVKALAFGIVITLVGVYQGLRVEGGAEDVGKRTTAAVVASIILVIVFDLFFTILFFFFT